jgi:hypothetical protein
MDYFLWGHVKFLVFAKRSSSRAELINQLMVATDQIRKVQGLVMWAVMSIVERAQMCVDNRGSHFKNA